jgi:dephospho-CoA kinase
VFSGEQVRRLVKRDGLTEAAAVMRLAAQWPIAEKIARATDVLDTTGTFEKTDRQVAAFCTALDHACADRPEDRRR